MSDFMSELAHSPVKKKSTIAYRIIDLDEISDHNLLTHFIDEIKKDELFGCPRKKLFRLGLIKFDHAKGKSLLTKKALDILGPDFSELL